MGEKRRLQDAAFQIWTAFTNDITPLVVFATYVYSGNVMTVANSVVARMMFNRLKREINHAQSTYQQYYEVQISIDRIYEFLTAEET